jgi:hypothetical protein
MFYSFIKLVFDRALCINVILFATRQHARSANATYSVCRGLHGWQASSAGSCGRSADDMDDLDEFEHAHHDDTD